MHNQMTKPEVYERWRQEDGTILCPLELTRMTTGDCEACQSELRMTAWQSRVWKACGVLVQDIDLSSFPWWEVPLGGEYLGGQRRCRDL